MEITTINYKNEKDFIIVHGANDGANPVRSATASE